MSEYEKNGGDYPDKGGTWSGPVSDDEVSQPEADGAVAHPGTENVVSERGTQDGPIQDTHTASIDEKIEGIIAQSRSDSAQSGDMDLPLLVRRRLEDAGIQASDDDIQRVVDRVGDVNDVTRVEPGVHTDR